MPWQGAAAWTATRCEDRSKRRRSASGSFSIRVNMVGTHWLWVTRWRSMAANAAVSSKRGIITTVPPWDWMPVQNDSGAEW